MPQRYRIQFPPEHEHDLAQDKVYFYLIENGEQVRLRFHDYPEIFRRPGLYEQLFYDRLKCTSPRKVSELLQRSLASEMLICSELRVLDLGAGNGMMAEELRKLGVSRVIGADIIKEAGEAAIRDRPTAYDDYKVADFTELSPEDLEELSDWNFDCLTSVAALGFGDIPPEAFFTALRLIPKDGWVAFNIKETFLDNSDQSGFSRFIRELIFSEYLDIYHLELYRHRLSMEGIPLKYFALVGRITTAVPADFLEKTL
ncbi:MAG: ubiquinone/menaquinone biosynthesis C-methylase UbiE [Verrucomicrobiales bacterium]|jgi:ubiquinone/menaquinone biosynthesis C-methylase UbiE